MFSHSVWIVAVIAATGIDLYVAFRHSVGARYISKPLIVAILLVFTAGVSTPVSGFYRFAVILGLLCSAAGDILLIRRNDRFLSGVAAFFLAHVLYSAAFISHGGTPETVLVIAVIALYSIILISILWPRAHGMRLPVVAYALMIGTMALLALEMWIAAPAGYTAAAAAGALCFVISDTILALDHFVISIPARTVLVMTTYAAAQLLIALSVAGG